MEDYPVFEFLPFETLISQNQDSYYKALSDSDSQGKSTAFIAYMLGVMDASLALLLDTRPQSLSDSDRIDYFIRKSGKSEFGRKDYLDFFKEISPATASRDLKKGVEVGLFSKEGDKKTTVYRVL